MPKIEINGYIVSNDDKMIYDFFGYSTTCPNDVRKAINEAGGQPLDVEISTCYGGLIDAGSEIYSMLKAYKGGIHIRITGIAASAASVIAMAGPSEISPTARMMVHNVSSFAGGDYHDMNQSSYILQQADKSIAAAYMAKSGMNEKDALGMMDQETWLTAQQAVDLKLIDKVMFSDDTHTLVAGLGLPLTKAVIEKTRKFLNEQKENPKAEPTPDVEKEKALLMVDLI